VIENQPYPEQASATQHWYFVSQAEVSLSKDPFGARFDASENNRKDAWTIYNHSHIGTAH
jgi:hypothetical protein